MCLKMGYTVPANIAYQIKWHNLIVNDYDKTIRGVPNFQSQTALFLGSKLEHRKNLAIHKGFSPTLLVLSR